MKQWSKRYPDADEQTDIVKRAYVVTVQLLVQADTPAEADDKICELLEVDFLGDWAYWRKRKDRLYFTPYHCSADYIEGDFLEVL